MSQDWEPLPYMTRAAGFLAGQRAAGLPFEPGGRKTSITLKAFSDLSAKDDKIRKMLVVAPLRVCRLVWPAEVQKWECFNHLRVSLLLGGREKRESALQADADIYVINPENIVWLCDQLVGKTWPFAIVCLDELTRWKKATGARAKHFRPFMRLAHYRWGLTGSLTSNGYADIFGQQLMLDDGAALGRYITRFREQYMSPGWDGFGYVMQPGAVERIADKIRPYWFQVDPKEYAQLPAIVDDIRICELDKKARETYETLERDSILKYGDEVLSADNSGALYNALAQLANGAIYNEGESVDGERPFKVIHDAKLDALEELLDDLNGTPLFLGYEFRHDLARIKQRFDERFKKYGGVPHIGSGVGERLEAERCAAWNSGSLPLLCAHPAAVGHGLNLQEGQAAHVGWFGTPWSWEQYDQFIRRVRRSGNLSNTVFNHLLIVPRTLDELKLTSVRQKFTNHKEFGALLGAYAKGELKMSEELPPGWRIPTPKTYTDEPAPPAEATPNKVPLPQFGGNGVDPGESAAARKTANAQSEDKPQPTQRQKIRDSVQQLASDTVKQQAQNKPLPLETVTEIGDERVEVTLKFSMDVRKLVRLMQ